MRAAVLLLLALAGSMLLAPFASAEAVGGTFTLEDLGLPAGTHAMVEPIALIDNHPADVSNFTVKTGTSAPLHVCRYELDSVEVAPDGSPILRAPLTTQPKEDCRDYLGASASIAPACGDGPCWVGIHAGPSSLLTFLASVDCSASARTDSTLASPDAQQGTSSDENQALFYAPVAEAHELWNGSGSLLFQGNGELRFLGLTMRVQSPNGTADYQTGVMTGTGPNAAHQRTVQWVSIGLSGATVQLASVAPVEFAAAHAPQVAWNGRASFDPVSGVLHATSRDYAVSSPGASAYLDGTFSGSFEPQGDAKAAVGSLVVSGDMRSTSLIARPGPPSVLPVSVPRWIGLVAFGAVVLTGATAAVVAHHRRRALPASKAHRLAKAAAQARHAMEAADAGNGRLAARGYGMAMIHDPSLAGLLMREKGAAERAEGRITDALETFEAARLASDDGEAEVLAAECALLLGEVSRAELLLLDALERSGLKGEVLEQIAHDSVFASLREKESIQRAIQAAAERTVLGDP